MQTAHRGHCNLTVASSVGAAFSGNHTDRRASFRRDAGEPRCASVYEAHALPLQTHRSWLWLWPCWPLPFGCTVNVLSYLKALALDVSFNSCWRPSRLRQPPVETARSVVRRWKPYADLTEYISKLLTS